MKIRYILLFTLFLFMTLPAQAQDSIPPNRAVMGYAKAMQTYCMGMGWTSQPCLGSTANSNKVLAANYISRLKEQGHETQANWVLDQCAAGTAVDQGTYPDSVIGTAYAECANGIYDASTATGLKPDLSHYQLLILATKCVQGNEQCAAMSQGLKR